MDREFSTYEKSIIKEIAQHIVEPSKLDVAFSMIGTPLEMAIKKLNQSENKLVQKVMGKVDESLTTAMDKVVRTANILCSETQILKEYRKRGIDVSEYGEIARQPLNKMDMVADCFDIGNGLIVGFEGAILSAATTLCEGSVIGSVLIPPLVALDVGASMTLLTRHVCQISSSYGYSSADPVNLPYILGAMCPRTSSNEDGFISTKMMVRNAVQEAKQFMAKSAEKVIDANAPKLLQLIDGILQRLAVTYTEKELGMLVPVLGIALNAGVNVAFQQMNHDTAKDYFRRLVLVEKYGEYVVNSAVEQEIARIQVA